MNRWHPMETAPRNGLEILLCLWGTDIIAAHWNQNKGPYHWRTFDGIGYLDEAATHWMPCPLLPSETPP